jgi:hypothetical protein
MAFCKNCGTNLDQDQNFCHSCGTAVDANIKEVSNAETYQFSSSAMVGGNIITPTKLTLDQNGVLYQKRSTYLISKDEIRIPYKSIVTVEIESGIFGAKISIFSSGNNKIVADNFIKSDAKKIKEIILANQS